MPHNQHLQLDQHPLQQYCMYILYLHIEKELASTSFGHMRAFSSLSSAISLLQCGDVKTRVMNNLLATFCLHFTRTLLESVYVQKFQRLINGTLFSGEFS